MLRTALIPAALLAALSLATADTAEAAPVHTSKAYFGPKVVVSGGIGIRVPIRSTRYVRSRAVVAAPTGYWKTIPYEVYVPGHLIGHDRFGNPILSQGHTEIRYRRVWVETSPPVVVRRHVRRVRPVGHVGLGLGIRIR